LRPFLYFAAIRTGRTAIEDSHHHADRVIAMRTGFPSADANRG
jgi:hypothetical protein